MLDRHPALAVPDESYFVPTLAARHRGALEPSRFCDDVARISTLRDWGVRPADVAERLRPDATTADAIAAIYEAYAAARGKERWGDKTPMYMSRLGLLERLFPTAVFVHLVRDGRDAARSFLEMPPGLVTESWAHPRDIAGFACQWRTEVRDAVASAAGSARAATWSSATSAGGRPGGGPARRLRVRRARVRSGHADLPRDARPRGQAAPGATRPAADGGSPRLAGRDGACRRGRRSRRSPATRWRRRGTTSRTRAHRGRRPGPGWRGTRRGSAAWRAAGTAVARSPLWARRHPRLD